MGVKNVYDRKPFLKPTDYGIKKQKILQNLWIFLMTKKINLDLQIGIIQNHTEEILLFIEDG